MSRSLAVCQNVCSVNCELGSGHVSVRWSYFSAVWRQRKFGYHFHSFHSVSCEVVSRFRMDLGKEVSLPLSLNKQTNVCIFTLQLYIIIISVLPLCPTVALPVSSNLERKTAPPIETSEGLCFQICEVFRNFLIRR